MTQLKSSTRTPDSDIGPDAAGTIRSPGAIVSPNGDAGVLTVCPSTVAWRQKPRCSSCGEPSWSAGSRSGKLGTWAVCAVSAIHCLSYRQLHADISACSASQFATRSGLVLKRALLPQSGEPIAASQDDH